MLFGVSMAIGLIMALAYHRFMTRSQLWLSRHSGNSLPALSVATLFLRLTLVAAAVVLLHLFTPVNVLVTASAFVGLFTVLNIYNLYRLTTGWARPDEAPVPGE